VRADHGILHGPHAGWKPIQALERRVIALDRDGLAGVPGVGAGAEHAQGPQDTVEEFGHERGIVAGDVGLRRCQVDGEAELRYRCQ
jgi:hypothetical protein